MNKHVNNRKIKLIKARITQNEIARMLGVPRQVVNAEIHGVKKSKRVREAICKLTGTTQDKFFPEHVKENGINVG